MDGKRSTDAPKPLVCEFLFHRNAENFLASAYRRLEQETDQKSHLRSSVQSEDRSTHQKALCQETHA